MNWTCAFAATVLIANADLAASSDRRFVVACDLVSDDGVKTTESFEIDADARTFDGKPAQVLNDRQIVYMALDASKKPIMTVEIDRYSGRIIMRDLFEFGHTWRGICRSSKQRF